MSCFESKNYDVDSLDLFPGYSCSHDKEGKRKYLQTLLTEDIFQECVSGKVKNEVYEFMLEKDPKKNALVKVFEEVHYIYSGITCRRQLVFYMFMRRFFSELPVNQIFDLMSCSTHLLIFDCLMRGITGQLQDEFPSLVIYLSSELADMKIENPYRFFAYDCCFYLDIEKLVWDVAELVPKKEESKVEENKSEKSICLSRLFDLSVDEMRMKSNFLKKFKLFNKEVKKECVQQLLKAFFEIDCSSNTHTSFYKAFKFLSDIWSILRVENIGCEQENKQKMEILGIYIRAYAAMLEDNLFYGILKKNPFTQNIYDSMDRFKQLIKERINIDSKKLFIFFISMSARGLSVALSNEKIRLIIFSIVLKQLEVNSTIVMRKAEILNFIADMEEFRTFLENLPDLGVFLNCLDKLAFDSIGRELIVDDIYELEFSTYEVESNREITVLSYSKEIQYIVDKFQITTEKSDVSFYLDYNFDSIDFFNGYQLIEGNEAEMRECLKLVFSLILVKNCNNKEVYRLVSDFQKGDNTLINIFREVLSIYAGITCGRQLFFYALVRYSFPSLASSEILSLMNTAFCEDILCELLNGSITEEFVQERLKKIATANKSLFFVCDFYFYFDYSCCKWELQSLEETQYFFPMFDNERQIALRFKSRFQKFNEEVDEPSIRELLDLFFKAFPSNNVHTNIYLAFKFLINRWNLIRNMSISSEEKIDMLRICAESYTGNFIESDFYQSLQSNKSTLQMHTFMIEFKFVHFEDRSDEIDDCKLFIFFTLVSVENLKVFLSCKKICFIIFFIVSKKMAFSSSAITRMAEALNFMATVIKIDVFIESFEYAEEFLHNLSSFIYKNYDIKLDLPDKNNLSDREFYVSCHECLSDIVNVFDYKGPPDDLRKYFDPTQKIAVRNFRRCDNRLNSNFRSPVNYIRYVTDEFMYGEKKFYVPHDKMFEYDPDIPMTN